MDDDEKRLRAYAEELCLPGGELTVHRLIDLHRVLRKRVRYMAAPHATELSFVRKRAAEFADAELVNKARAYDRVLHELTAYVEQLGKPGLPLTVSDLIESHRNLHCSTSSTLCGGD